MTSTRLISAALILALAGCTQTQVKPVRLPLPAEPILTPVPPNAVQCLDAGTYVALVNRERALRTWGKELSAVIAANNAKAAQ